MASFLTFWVVKIPFTGIPLIHRYGPLPLLRYHFILPEPINKPKPVEHDRPRCIVFPLKEDYLLELLVDGLKRLLQVLSDWVYPLEGGMEVLLGYFDGVCRVFVGSGGGSDGDIWLG